MDEIHDQQTEKLTRGICLQCGDEFDIARFKLGLRTCMVCGDKLAHKVRRCIVPVVKSNYMVVTDLSLLRGLNKYESQEHTPYEAIIARKKRGYE